VGSLFSSDVPVAAITGKVTDDNGQALPGVSVVLKGSTTGTTTNTAGEYSLTTPGTTGTLVFSYVGFLTVEEAINGRSTINVKMATDTKSLSEVVVVGYGS